MLILKTMLVEAENAIGLFLSRKRMREAEKYLSHNNFINYSEFESYKEAMAWVCYKYKNDYELNLEDLRPNRLIFRDTSLRHNFYFVSDNYIGYGITEEDESKICSELSGYDRATGEFIYVETTQEAIYGARHGFDERYTGKNYYNGLLIPGELVSAKKVQAVKYHHRKIDLWDDE